MPTKTLDFPRPTLKEGTTHFPGSEGLSYEAEAVRQSILKGRKEVLYKDDFKATRVNVLRQMIEPHIDTLLILSSQGWFWGPRRYLVTLLERNCHPVYSNCAPQLKNQYIATHQCVVLSFGAVH